MEYNVHGDGDHPFCFCRSERLSQFRQLSVFGPSDEVVCGHEAQGLTPDDSTSADVLVYVRYGTPPAQVVDGLLAAAIRVDEDETLQ